MQHTALTAAEVAVVAHLAAEVKEKVQLAEQGLQPHQHMDLGVQHDHHAAVTG